MAAAASALARMQSAIKGRNGMAWARQLIGDALADLPRPPGDETPDDEGNEEAEEEAEDEAKEEEDSEDAPFLSLLFPHLNVPASHKTKAALLPASTPPRSTQAPRIQETPPRPQRVTDFSAVLLL